MAGEEGIGLGASFEGPGFAPTRAVWEGIASDVEEQLFVELAAHFLKWGQWGQILNTDIWWCIRSLSFDLPPRKITLASRRPLP